MFGSYPFGKSYFAQGDAVTTPVVTPVPGLPYEYWPEFDLKRPKRARDRERERQQQRPRFTYGDIAGQSEGESGSWLELAGQAMFEAQSFGTSKAEGVISWMGYIQSESVGESYSEAQLQAIGNVASKPPVKLEYEEMLAVLFMLDG